MPLSHLDDKLTRSINRRPRKPGDGEAELRTVIFHRLHTEAKLVVRLGIRSGFYSAFCEPCGSWFKNDDVEDTVQEVRCPQCGRLYVLEAAVYALEEGPNGARG